MDEIIYLFLVPLGLVLILGAAALMFYFQVKADRKKYKKRRAESRGKS